jgi:hypothetical protein
VKWESRLWKGDGSNYKADGSLRSFLFTLKNPHNIPARRVALKADERWRAINCDSRGGPNFNDIAVSDNCNANVRNDISLGSSYTNDTGLDDQIVFTGSHWFQQDGNFKVKEIEVFEITD